MKMDSASLPRRLGVLVFVDHYLPGFKSGGPVRSIMGMVEVLSDRFDFYIVCYNRDHLDFLPYPNIVGGQWHQVGLAKVFYLTKAAELGRYWKDILHRVKPDYVYLNSYFSSFTIHFLALRRLGRVPQSIRCIIAPRGELGGGALKQKEAKKRVFIFLFSKLLSIYGGLRWHASTELEKQEILALPDGLFGRKQKEIQVASDIVPQQTNKTATARSRPKQAGVLRLLFLSRVSPKKNLRFIFPFMEKLGRGASLSVYGQEEPGYGGSCRAIAAAELGDAVKFMGPIEHSKINGVFAEHDFFLLPTLNENFGHAIVEAFEGGLPAFISDNTPWRNLEAKGIGWDISLSDEEAWLRALKKALSMGPVEHMEMSNAASKFGKEAASTPDIKGNLALFV